MTKVYRVENQRTKHGIWRDFEGNYNPVFKMLSDGKSKHLPMEDNPLYRKNGEKWFASAPTKEALKEWFSRQDVYELRSRDYNIYEYEVSHVETVSEYETIFRREDIISQRELGIYDVWDESTIKEGVRELAEEVLERAGVEGTQIIISAVEKERNDRIVQVVNEQTHFGITRVMNWMDAYDLMHLLTNIK